MFCITLFEIGRARVVFFFFPQRILGAGRTLKSSVKNSHFDIFFFQCYLFFISANKVLLKYKLLVQAGWDYFPFKQRCHSTVPGKRTNRVWFISKHNWTHFWWPDFPLNVSDILSMQVNYHGHMCTTDEAQSKTWLKSA